MAAGQRQIMSKDTDAFLLASARFDINTGEPGFLCGTPLRAKREIHPRSCDMCSIHMRIT